MKETQKKYIHKQDGITLITLTLVVILLGILATVIVRNSIASYNNSKIIEFIAEMQAIQKRVDLAIENNENYQTLGKSIEGNTKATTILGNAFNNGEIIGNYKTEKSNVYRYFDVKDLYNVFDIENAKGDVIINFETREVVSMSGIEYDQKTYYTQYNLPGGTKVIQFSEGQTRSTSSIELSAVYDGLNATILVKKVPITNGKVVYQLNDGQWQVAENYTTYNKDCAIIVSVSGNYKVRLYDNNDETNYTEKSIDIIVANKPTLEMNMELLSSTYTYADYKTSSEMWAYATKDSLTYVWVPRFAYDASGNIKFLRGSSNIATDNTYIDSTWTIPKKFTKDGIELTGLWKRQDKTSSAKLKDLVN